MRTITEILKGTKYDNHQLEMFLIECSVDYLYFAEHVLGFEIADYHREWHDILEKFSRVCIQAFRGSGKTNFIAGYFLWKGIFVGKRNILIVSTTFEQAKIVLKLVRNMVSDNELLKYYVPSNKDASWRATELTLSNGTVFYSRTYGENIKGLRIDEVLCDEAGQYEDKAIFWVAISPVVQLNRGRIVVIGTPVSHIDLLHELADNDEYYSGVYPAERDGKPLWPQKYTTHPHDIYDKRSLVAVRKEIGELPYMQEFLLIPISTANSLFPYEMTMKALDEKEVFYQYGRVGDKYYVGADFALSAKGDFTVFTVIKANQLGKQVVYATRFRGSFEEQRSRLTKIYNDFKPIKILADKTGLGEQIFKQLSETIPNMEPLHFTAEAKYKMILDLRHEFENYNLLIPNSKDDQNSYNYAQQLLKELNEFILKVKTDTGRVKFSGGQYDDTVISLALANQASLNQYGDFSIRAF